jgi:glycosyltransferase involved in cell wall biosynthesis
VSNLAVGIDVSPLAQTAAGTHRHVAALLDGLAARPGLSLRRYAFGGGGRATAVARDLAWYLAALPAEARRDGVDVLHCPTFRAPVASSVPLVVTFHDLAVLRHPGAFNRWTRTYSRAVLPRVARAARRVIAVSAFTASEVVSLLGIPASRVAVVPNGVGPPFAEVGEAADGDYVLAVGTLEPRKNLARLVEGFRRSRLAGECELRVVGAQGWGAVRVDGDGVRWLGRVPDEELARLYRGARCAAYVSLYEGFGLPVLEAMACGAPAVAADVPALRELADGAAVLVDGLSPEAIAAGLDEAAARRDELRAAGLERARAFGWDAAAAATHAVYREAARA